MDSTTPPAPVSKPILWTSRIMIALPVSMMLMSAVFKFLSPPEVVKSFEHLVVHERGHHPRCPATRLCDPVCDSRTAVLGAILLTGYLGGAIATCVRVGDG